jgi:hypothetical protein
MSPPPSQNLVAGFVDTLEALEDAAPILKEERTRRLLSQVDVLTDSRAGLDVLLEHMPRLTQAGVFDRGPWEEPDRLVPALVGGTLRAGDGTTLMEILSELRMVAAAEGRLSLPGVSRSQARTFLRNVLVNTLDLLFPPETEEERNLAPSIRKKVDHLMSVLVEHVPLDQVKGALATEIQLICLQRPIVTDRALRMIELIRRNVELDPEREEDRALYRFVRAVTAPSAAAGERSPEEYAEYLDSASRPKVGEECRALAASLRDTGLAVPHHAVLARRLTSRPSLLAEFLGLDSTGRAELDKHRDFVGELVDVAIHPSTARSVYGLGRLLDGGLLSHQPVINGLRRLRSLELHPQVEEIIRASAPKSGLAARQLLLADCLGVLGQPLGVAQGRNPTCQSARGISLWSQHAPGKLLGMIQTVASTNQLSMRFEAGVIRSGEVGPGLAKEFDHDLDAVSVVLVPHLDRIYNEMMHRAANRGDDPHRWVNPAMYGHWIPTGFASAYEQATGFIRDYEGFLRTFYATHHPDFNRGHDLAYPNPVGIFLTGSAGSLIGFHAVSILRVRQVRGQVRVFIYNPNSEGRQRWHAEIRPTVAGHGEKPGESSLPFDQFASRIYAFHYSPSDTGDPDAVDQDRIEAVTQAARESWGTSYTWV